MYRRHLCSGGCLHLHQLFCWFLLHRYNLRCGAGVCRRHLFSRRPDQLHSVSCWVRLSLNYSGHCPGLCLRFLCDGGANNMHELSSGTQLYFGGLHSGLQHRGLLCSG